jgi:hypothetical protein
VFVFDIVGPGGLTPLPEPTSTAIWGLLGLGCVAYGGRRHRRKATQAAQKPLARACISPASRANSSRLFCYATGFKPARPGSF